MFYRIFGYWIRRDACRLAAAALKANDSLDGSYAPRLWSLTVFFEKYLLDGADGTLEDFGPKDPVQIKPVEVA